MSRIPLLPATSILAAALVLAACNEALRKSRELVQQELGKLTGGLKIPGMGM